MKKIKKILIKKLNKDQINRIIYYKGVKYYREFKKYKNKRKIIHILTPIHGNMGDQAIVHATNKYLKDNFKDYEILEIYRRDIYKYMKALKKVINLEDIIVLIGGGNIGNLWKDEEIDRRFIIKNFPNNKIISMPQTISFTTDSDGNIELAKTKRVYNKNNNLMLISRERKSYKLMKSYFENKNIKLNPDTVLYLSNTIDANKYKREYIMTCLRSDKESILGNKKDILINKLKSEFGEIIEYDTVVDKVIFKEQREKELNDMFDKFLKAKIVITDRLHGMIFCVITQTPCIVTKSLDHKVTGTYEWIKDLNYIKLVDDLTVEKIKPLIDELSNLKRIMKIDFDNLYFRRLTQNIKEFIATS